MGTAPEFGPSSEFPPEPSAIARLQVVFLCFGNACRSQMAEGFARHRNLEWLDARSAGLHALGYIPAETIEVMQEAGISLDGHVSKGVEEIDWERVSILVEMAGLPGAIREFAGRRFVWDIPDPFQGSLEEYRRVRDLVGKKVEELIETLKREFSGGAGPPQPS